jgi:hypothetical protein
MKIFKLILAILIITSATSVFAKRGNPNAVRVLSVKRDIFYFKVCQSFIGGTIEIYGKDGKLAFSNKIVSHKAIVDFYFQEPGTYEIKIKKDDREVSYDYNKSTPKPEGDATVNSETFSMIKQG